MMKCLKTKLSKFFHRQKMSAWEQYLSEATDLVDLENRMKYGFRNKNFANMYDNYRNKAIWFVGGV
jgi:hypothetical protein